MSFERKIGLIAYCLIILSWELKAQNIFSAMVLDVEDKRPVPYCHVRIVGTNTGTITNEQGRFTIYNDNRSNNQLTIQISSVGYQRSTHILEKEKEKLIYLKRINLYLKEVVVVPKDFEKDILKKAVDAIDTNYPQRDEFYTGFIRETLSSDSLSEEIYYISEGELTVFKESYEKIQSHGIVKMNKGRKVVSSAFDSLYLKVYAGPHLPHRFDHVKRRDGPLKISHLDNYDLMLSDTILYGGQMLFEIKFDHKRGKEKGSVFILDSTYAIVKFTLNKDPSSWIFTGSGDRIYHYSSSEYELTDVMWRLKLVKYSTGLTRPNSNIYLNSIYVTSDILKNTSLEEINYDERIGYLDIFEEKVDNYDPEFWRGYLTIASDSTMEKVFQKHQSIRRKPSFKTRFFDVLTRLDLSYGLYGTKITSSIDSVKYAYQSSKVDHSFQTGLTSNVQYQFRNGFSIGIESMTSFSKRKLNGNWFVFKKDIALSHKVKSLFINPALKIGYLKVREKVFTIDTNQEYVINSKVFNADKTDVFLETKSVSLSPSLGFSAEISNHFMFTVEASYNFNYLNVNGMYFVEDEFFLRRKRTYIRNDHADVSIYSRGSGALKYNYLVSAMVTFSI